MLELQRSSSSTGHIFDVAIFSAFIKIFASAGDWTKCEAMLAHMLAEDIEPNVVTYTSLLKYCERIGSWKKAAELLEQMKTKDKLTPDVVFYTSLINVCCTRYNHGHLSLTKRTVHLSFCHSHAEMICNKLSKYLVK